MQNFGARIEYIYVCQFISPKGTNIATSIFPLPTSFTQAGWRQSAAGISEVLDKFCRQEVATTVPLD